MDPSTSRKVELSVGAAAGQGRKREPIPIVDPRSGATVAAVRPAVSPSGRHRGPVATIDPESGQRVIPGPIVGPASADKVWQEVLGASSLLGPSHPRLRGGRVVGVVVVGWIATSCGLVRLWAVSASLPLPQPMPVPRPQGQGGKEGSGGCR